MKKLPLLLILLFPLSIVFSQEKCKDRKNQIIVYDFLTGEYENPRPRLCQRVPTVFKIKNINTYFYDIQIQSKDISINSEDLYSLPLDEKKTGIIKIDTTAVLGLLDTRSVNLLPIASIKNSDNITVNQLNIVKQKESKKNNSASELKNLENYLAELLHQKIQFEKYSDFSSKKQELKSKIIVAPKNKEDSIKNQSILSKISNIDEFINGYETEFNGIDLGKLTTDIQSAKDAVDKKKEELFLTSNEFEIEFMKLQNEKEILSIINNGISELNKKFIDLDKKFSDVLKIAGAYNNFIAKIYRPNLDSTNYQRIKYPTEDFETTAILQKSKLDEYYGQIKRFNQTYKDFQSGYLSGVSLLNNPNSETLILIKSSLQNEFNRIKTTADQMLNKVESMDLNSKLNAVEIYNRELQNPNTFNYTSDPLQGQGDYIEFNVTIKPKTTYKEVLVKNQNRNFKYSEYLRRGVRYDFSVGTVFDFINKDEKYENRNGTLTKISQNKYYPTLAGMFHVSLRSSTLCSGGFTLGASLNVAELDINSLFAGPSLLIGKKEKIIFTTGLSFRKTNQLKRGYNDGFSIGQNDVSIYETDNFRFGMFVGVTYNLTKKQKSTLKIKNNEP